MIDNPEYVPITFMKSDDGSKKVWIYFGLKEHHERYVYGDFIDTLEPENCKFIIFPLAKYDIAEIEDEAESYVLEPRKEKVK